MEYGFLSLIPPLLTIVLALVTKNVFVSLFIGGELALEKGQILQAHLGKAIRK